MRTRNPLYHAGCGGAVESRAQIHDGGLTTRRLVCAKCECHIQDSMELVPHTPALKRDAVIDRVGYVAATYANA